MPKKANELKKGDTIKIAGKTCVIENLEISDIGKQGTRKVRIDAKTAQGEKVIVIRPENYPFQTE